MYPEGGLTTLNVYHIAASSALTSLISQPMMSLGHNMVSANIKTQIKELIGDPKEIDRELEEFRRAAKTFSSDHPRLIDEYPKQWVAVYCGKVEASGRTFGSVMAQVDRKGLPRERVIVRFIDRSQRTMIL